MKIVIITGQTATGKTKLALEMAEKYKGELVNSDSRQIYKKLDIITGKDIIKSSKFKAQSSKLIVTDKINDFEIGYYQLTTNLNKLPSISTKIWLYDIVDPKKYFSSYDWTQCALFVIKKLLKQKITPIIVGGTYFYLRHLLYQIDTEKIPPNWKLRNKLANKSVKDLQKILKSLDKKSLEQLNNSDLNNPRRLIRKIEILSTINRLPPPPITPPGCILARKIGLKNAKIQFFGLKFKDKETLRSTIKNRVEERIKLGAIEEVKNLLQQEYSLNDPGLKTIGYQQIIDYLHGKISKQEAIDQWITKEIQYAKRQLTFMKKDKNIIWREI